MPPPYYPPGPRPLSFQSPAAIVGIIVVVVVGAFMAIAVMTMSAGFMGFTSFILLPVCGIMVVVLIVIVLAATQGFAQQRIPPPPPIQQPMVPAGQTGPVALNCPNCGAPPQNVDRFGVATCTYCNTRFLVR